MTPDNLQAEVSVVIVSWNTRELVDRCLRSVIDEAETAHVSTQIIVVDNASSDGTVEFLRDHHPFVTCLPLRQNSGFAAANNRGIERSHGRAVLLLNPDTELRPGALTSMLKALYSMPHVGLISALLLNPDGSVQSAGYRFPGYLQSLLDFFPIHPRLIESRANGRISPGDHVAPYAVDHPLGACMLVRREVIDRVGPLDEQYFMYSEEIDWCRRIRGAGWTILIAPEAQVIHHRGQSTRQMPESMFRELHRSRARYFARHRSPQFLRSVELMARAAAICSRARGRSLGGHDADSLRSAADIYRQARAADE